MIGKEDLPVPDFPQILCGAINPHMAHLWHGDILAATVRCPGVKTREARSLRAVDSHNYPEGWYEWIRQPFATTHIAYVQENGGIYLPEDGVHYRDFHDAMEKGRAWRMIRVDRVLNAVSSLV